METVLDFVGAWLDFPIPFAGPMVGSQSESYLYVIGYGSGTVKVGHSRQPKRRVADHVSDAARHGLVVTRAWVSGSHVEAERNEDALVKACKARCSTRTGREYFGGVDVEDIIAVARLLPATRDSSGPSLKERRQRRSAADAEFMRQVRSGYYVIVHGSAWEKYVDVAAGADEALALFRNLFVTRGGPAGAAHRRASDAATRGGLPRTASVSAAGVADGLQLRVRSAQESVNQTAG